jgi:hypothetical protein
MMRMHIVVSHTAKLCHSMHLYMVKERQLAVIGHPDVLENAIACQSHTAAVHSRRRARLRREQSQPYEKTFQMDT